MVDKIEHKGKIFLVPFGYQGATQFLFNKTIKNISGNDFSSILYIGPTPRKIRDAQLSFTKLIPSNSFIPPRFATIKQFTSELFDEHNRDKKKLSDFCKPLLIQKLKPGISLGYAQSIAEFIRETKQYLPDLTDTKLKTRILQEITTRGCNENHDIYKKVQDILHILSKYHKSLQSNNWLDSEDIASASLQLVIDQLKVKRLILDGFFYDLTALEEKIVAALIEKSEMVFALSFYDKRTPESYALPQEFLSFLRRMKVLDEEIIAQATELRKDIPYYACASLEEEVEFIASHIKKSFLDKKLSLNRTVVCFSRLNEYESAVERTFQKYQIPYSIYSSQSLKQTQPIIAVLELLRAITNNYPRLSTVAALSSPYFNRFAGQTKELINHLSKKTGIIKSAGSWKTLSTTAQAIYADEYRSTPLLTQTINKIQDDINTFLVLSEKFKQPNNSLSKYTHGLRQLLAQFQWCENNHDQEKDTIAAKNEFYNLLAMLERFETDFGETNVLLEDFLKILEYFLDQIEIIPDLSLGGVTVLGFAETRGLDCDSLFFAGLSEDKFPGSTRFDPILPEWLKQKLCLPSIERHLFRTRFHYFRLVNTARVNTFLSYYNTDQDRLLLPSPFLTGEAKSPDKFDIIFSPEQLAQEQGRKNKIDLFSLISTVNFSQDRQVQQILDKKYGTRSKPSVTKLESYAYCPYQFYLQNILAIESLAEPAYEIEPTLWGSIAHQVFERLYKSGAVPVEQIPARLEKILEVVLTEHKLSRFWADVAKKIFLDFIPWFVKNEQQLREQGFVPVSVENRLHASVKPGMTITGRIDRLDQNPQTKQLLVLDYKTGKADGLSAGRVESGAHLQLPLYAFLVKKTHKTSQVVNAGIYSVVDNRIIKLVKKDQNINDLINHALKHAQAIIRYIRQGKFNFMPVNLNNCNYCEHAPICPNRLNPNPELLFEEPDLNLFEN
ncbi:MAG: PD-(D/E)XK nuclease family protein [Candidatus Latescibacteria bacterium]|nr:PD-(D/E)XK nuclease family protein [Candidatus Latescibacterota bacterium]